MGHDDFSQYNRRSSDRRIDALVENIATMRAEHVTLKAEVAENTRLTKEVLEGIKAFKVLGTLAKWVSTIALAGGVLWAGAEHAVEIWRKLRSG